MKLRDYQEECVQTVHKEFANGKNKQVIVMATGLGKTVVFSHLAKDLIEKTGKKVLILAHREELLTQAQNKLGKVAPDLLSEIEQADNHSTSEANVVIASVPTIGRINSSRIAKFDPKEFCAIIADECHHASAETYKNVFRHFGVLKRPSEESVLKANKINTDVLRDKNGLFAKLEEVNPEDWNKDCLLLGVTATPNRADNKGIDQVFDDVTYQIGIIDGIKRGWLSPIRAYRINTSTDLSSVRTLAGDFNLEQLGSAVNNEERNSLVVKTYNDRFAGKQALCFAVDVEHVLALEAKFREQGVIVTNILGSTPTEERKQRLEAFYKKEVQVVVNCMTLTEGYDNEHVEVILMTRPTQSGILFQQMVGRGTRRVQNPDGSFSDAKPYVSVCDFVDNTYRQRLQTSSTLVGLDEQVDFGGQDILEVKEKIDNIRDYFPNIDVKKLDMTRLDYVLEEVDLTSGLAVPDEISQYTTYDWHRYADGDFRVNLGNNRYIVVEEKITGQYVVKERLFEKGTQQETVTEVREYADMQSAINGADRYIATKHTESLRLVDTRASWRKERPTESQVKYLKKYGVNATLIDSIGKGDASRILDKLFNRKARHNERW